MTLASRTLCTDIPYMTTGMEDSVRRALELAPASLMALAREAGVSEVLLRHIRSGKRSATPETVEALAAAMDALSGKHTDAAQILRESLSAWRVR